MLTDEQQQLVEQNMHIAERVAHVYCRSRNVPAHQYDDVYSDACTGLMTAAMKFDPSRGAPFTSFARLKCHGEIVDQLRVRTKWRSPHRKRDTRRVSNPHSLDAILCETDMGKPVDADTIGGPTVDPDLRLDDRDEADAMLRRAELNREEKMMYLLYHHEQMTMKEIGKVIGITESRVSQKMLGINHRMRAARERMLNGTG